MSPGLRILSCIFLLVSCLLSGAIAQENSADSAVAAADIYLDCRDCDFDFFRTEINYVNFVRDRQQADIHILVSTLRTGSGGREYTIEFIGREEFDGLVDTLQYISLEYDTDDAVRKGLVHRVKLGLVRFIARTPSSDDLSVSYTRPVQKTDRVDKWNYWVFSVAANTWLNGQQSQRSLNLWWNVNARRVTEELKLSFGIWGSYNEQKFNYESIQTLSLSRSKGGEGNFIFSLTDHWSAGFSFSLSSSTFSNLKFQSWNDAGVEYNIFPYDQSTQRQLRIDYRLSFSYVDYEEITIFDKTNEWLSRGRLGAELELIQPWGNVVASLWASHYFHDFSKNRVQVRSRVSLRLVKGLSLNVNGSVSRIRDQLSLRKGAATEDEVLLRRRELATSYDYWTSFGVSYTFGSIYNNIVNPRFGD